MKKILLLSIFLSTAFFGYGQTYQDSLLRSAGFFVSPGLTSFLGPGLSEPTHPRYGMSLGFRFKNEIKSGFFLEGGVGITSFGTRYKAEWDTTITYLGDTLDIIERQNNVTHLNITTPFLAGYRTKSGRVRFECAMGFAFNLQLFRYSKTNETNHKIRRDDVDRDLEPGFLPSFSAVARAGISVPVNERATFDVLPTLRYNFLQFRADDLDAFQCMHTDINKWSAGIDIGFTWKLSNVSTYRPYDESMKADDNAYTIRYDDSTSHAQKAIKKRPTGPKNFIYLEAGGTGLVLSHNYERTVFRKDEFSLQARAGFGMIPDNYFIPFGVNVAFGKHNKKFEMGLGACVENLTYDDAWDEDRFTVHMVPSMAFRLEAHNHFFLRLSLMSRYFFDSGELLPGIGVSVGGCF
jgi:hypothetical protein